MLETVEWVTLKRILIFIYSFTSKWGREAYSDILDSSVFVMRPMVLCVVHIYSSSSTEISWNALASLVGSLLSGNGLFLLLHKITIISIFLHSQPKGKSSTPVSLSPSFQCSAAAICYAMNFPFFWFSFNETYTCSWYRHTNLDKLWVILGSNLLRGCTTFSSVPANIPWIWVGFLNGWLFLGFNSDTEILSFQLDTKLSWALLKIFEDEMFLSNSVLVHSFFNITSLAVKFLQTFPLCFPGLILILESLRALISFWILNLALH